MFSDIKENVLSCKHTRNLRREIKTTGTKEKMIELKYVIWKTKTFIGLDSQNWDNRVKNQWLWIYIKRKNTMWRRLENNEKCKQNLKHLENYVKLCNACVIRVLERNEVENKVEKIWKK